jgi:PAS domain S-box-containing protein
MHTSPQNGHFNVNIYNAEQLATLNRMGQLITASLSLPKVLNHVIEEVPRLIETEGVAVLLKAGVDELMFAVVSGEGAEGLHGTKIPSDAGVAGEVMRTGLPTKISKATDQNKIYREVEKKNLYHTQSLLAVPLLLHGEVIGVLEAAHSRLNTYNDNDLRILESAASWIALAIHNAQLFEKARQEIKERKVAEEAMRESEARYRTLTELAPVGIFSTDENGRFTFVNEQWSAIVGLSPKEANGNGWTQNLHPDDKETVQAEWSQTIQTKTNFFLEFRCKPAEGETVWVMGQAVPHYDQSNNFHGYIGTFTDITEREAMRQAQKLASLGTLVGTIAHDFNNLLSAIFNHAELALMLSQEGTNSAGHIKRVIDTTSHATKLTQQLLTYSGIGNPVTERIDLNALIQDSMYLLDVAIPRNTKLITNLSQEPLIFEASRTQLQQVIMNLLINGAESFQGKQGVITISTGQEEVTAVNAHASQLFDPITPGNYIQLLVEDNGCGISPETLNKIFDPFFTTKSRGHGLGVSGRFRHHARAKWRHLGRKRNRQGNCF